MADATTAASPPVATSADAPNNFQDPYWTQLASATSDKLGLPPGLLSAIVTRGERTNADQVSSAGAKTPFQIIPSTRAAALDKYGIDAYLSPQNAAEVAGNLLKDSLTRSGGNIPQAVAEYHGGTDPSNWGPKTQAYVQRVTGAPLSAAPSPPPAAATQSTFDRVMAQMKDQQATNSVQTLFNAYQGGQMTPEQRQHFESDVNAGRIMLPQGASLDSPSADTSASPEAQVTAGGNVPPALLAAFSQGTMTPQQYGQFESDVRSGAFTLPQGMDADTLFGTPDQPKSIIDRIASIPGALKEAFTGAQRRTPTTDAYPDWTALPELSEGDLWPRLKTALGTMAGSPDDIAQVIKANFPNVQVGRDEKGNILMQSGIDPNTTVAIKPGFNGADDAVRMGQAGTTFALANEVVPGSGVRGLIGNTAREAVVGAVGQTALETAKAATGGNFDASAIPTAAAMGAVAPSVTTALRATTTPARALLDRVRGVESPATPISVAADGAAGAARSADTGAPAVDTSGDAGAGPASPQASAAPAAAAVPPSVAVPAPAGPSVQAIAQTARDAASGSKSATEDLAAMAAPDAATTAAAQRLGIQDYLQPDHVTTSDAYRQVLGVLKSNPTSALALGEKEGLAQVGKRASDLIDEIGGTNDLSGLNADMKSQMTAAHTEASNAEDALWNKLRATIPARQPAPASNTLDFLQQRLDDLGGDVKSLTPMERDIMARATPKQVSQTVDVPDNPLMPGSIRGTTTQEVQPTYARIDDIRRDVGMAARQAGPFSDADTGLAKKYYGLLTQDQEAAAGPGNADLIQQAKAATQVRKGMEDDMTALFGKKLDQSMAPDLVNSMRAAARNGDASGLVNLLKATPDNMKPQVVASGLGTVIRNAAARGDISFGQFSKWWDNLQRNRTAFAAVMANLAPEARQQIADLATVSKGISDSLNARIKTGLRSSVLDELNAPDSLAKRLFDVAKHAGKGLAADAVGGHGAGLAMGLMSALKGGAKPSAVKAIDELMTSPEFLNLARAQGTPAQGAAIKSMANSKSFNKFAAAIGRVPALSNRERFILNAMQAASAKGDDVAHPSIKR